MLTVKVVKTKANTYDDQREIIIPAKRVDLNCHPGTDYEYVTVLDTHGDYHSYDLNEMRVIYVENMAGKTVMRYFNDVPVQQVW